MIYKITQKDIDRGKPRETEKCPVGLVISETMGAYVEVCEPHITIEDTTYTNCQQLARWIKRYDEYEDVEPIEIELFDVNADCEDEEDYGGTNLQAQIIYAEDGYGNS